MAGFSPFVDGTTRLYFYVVDPDLTLVFPTESISELELISHVANTRKRSQLSRLFSDVQFLAIPVSRNTPTRFWYQTWASVVWYGYMTASTRDYWSRTSVGSSVRASCWHSEHTDGCGV